MWTCSKFLEGWECNLNIYIYMCLWKGLCFYTHRALSGIYATNWRQLIDDRLFYWVHVSQCTRCCVAEFFFFLAWDVTTLFDTECVASLSHIKNGNQWIKVTLDWLRKVVVFLLSVLGNSKVRAERRVSNSRDDLTKWFTRRMKRYRTFISRQNIVSSAKLQHIFDHTAPFKGL